MISTNYEVDFMHIFSDSHQEKETGEKFSIFLSTRFYFFRFYYQLFLKISFCKYFEKDVQLNDFVWFLFYSPRSSSASV